MKLPNKRNLVLIILVICFFVLLIFTIYFFIERSKKDTDSSYWLSTEYSEFYKFRVNNEDSGDDTFSVKGYVVLSEILQENEEILINLGLIIYNKDILENEVLPLVLPLNKTNLGTEDIPTLKVGDNVNILFKKENDTIEYVEFSTINLLEKEKGYLFNLFELIENSYEESSKEKLYDPIISVSVEELSRRNFFSDEEIFRIEQYLNKIKTKESDLSSSFAPCFVAKYRDINYTPNFSLLDEELQKDNTPKNPLELSDSLFWESLEDPNIHKLLIENYLRKLADEITYCGLNYENSLEKFNKLLIYTARYENINRETVKWIAEIVRELEQYGYSSASFSDFQTYFDIENYFNIEEDKFFRECILNRCDKSDILAKVSMYLKDTNEGKTFNNGTNDIDLAISLTLLSILNND